ncbi:MAG: ATP-binding cassette domain-containing protein [Proteobacteria bacterium]|nr:ATP-binding cassette domain-containing protein [Pseudomonadota bacterium]
MENTLIEFQNVTKRFGNRVILDKVNFEIYDGHVTTIMGKSGTGKSVLLKHIIGLLSPTDGRILFRGKPLDEMSRRELDEFRNQFSYCFQHNALFDSLTVFENVALPLQYTTNMDKKEIERKVLEKVDQLELSEVPYKYPSELSGGMQKRVALARALITDPRIVLFDEPTTGQDPIRKNAILGMIVQNQKKFGFTTIMVSHEIPDVFFISDRILILHDGQIIFQGSYNELDQLKHPMVDEFVKSLEGFQDELTGLHSKKNFITLYEKDVKQKEPHEAITVVIFTLDDLDGLSENVGHTQAQEVIQFLGEYVNKHFGDMGISARLGRDQIATILPQADRNSAERMVNDFVRELQEQGLGDIRSEAQAESPSAEGYTFSISVGVAEGKASEDLEIISERARSEQKTVARFRC